MNVSLLCRRQRCRMQQPEPLDSERARSSLTVITDRPLRVPGAPTGQGAKGRFHDWFSLQTLVSRRSTVTTARSS